METPREKVIARGEKTVSQWYMDNIVKILYYTTSSWNHCIQSKFRSRRSLPSGLMGLCGCNLKEKLECANGIHDGNNRHRIRISKSGERQKICWIFAMKIRGNILCSRELGGMCCGWNAYHENLDMIDEVKHLPRAWIWKTVSLLYYSLFGGDLMSIVCLVTSVENVSVQIVFWSLGPLSKTCLLQKRLSLSAVKAMVIFHVCCDRWCLYSCG